MLIIAITFGLFIVFCLGVACMIRCRQREEQRNREKSKGKKVKANKERKKKQSEGPPTMLGSVLDRDEIDDELVYNASVNPDNDQQ